MSSASEKARFYLEQTVPELREWERREIFSKPEISSINAQRSSYEHILNSREATPQTYARYLTYEQNLSSLARKRILRKGLKSASKEHARATQKRIFGLLDRATRRFHGDLALWTQYLEFCRGCGAHRRHERVLTEVLRLFPTRPEVWCYAAGRAEGQGDISGVRGCFMRGTRFCRRDWGLYVEWARMEMRWLARIQGRREVLGLDGKAIEGGSGEGSQEADGEGADVIALPPATAGEVESGVIGEDGEHSRSLERLNLTPAMSGAIPMAIFNSAMEKFGNDDTLVGRFFDMFVEFCHVPCSRKILRHVLETGEAVTGSSPVIHSCYCRLPIIGLPTDSPLFPGALRQSLNEAKSRIADLDNKHTLAAQLQIWLSRLTEDENLIPELQAVVSATLGYVSQVAKQSHDV